MTHSAGSTVGTPGGPKVTSGATKVSLPLFIQEVTTLVIRDSMIFVFCSPLPSKLNSKMNINWRNLNEELTLAGVCTVSRLCVRVRD